MSVCEIDNTKLNGPGSVYDDRMGSSLESKQNCITCGLEPLKCPGHFGHIVLNEPVINPLYTKKVVTFLRSFCKKCSRLLLTKEQIELRNLCSPTMEGEDIFTSVTTNIRKSSVCPHCHSYQPDVAYSIKDDIISLVYDRNLVDEPEKYSSGGKSKISIAMTVDDIKKILDLITNDDLRLIGIDSSLSHPKDAIMSMFPVPPPHMRPFVVADGTICDDDLTTQILEILKVNANLGNPEKMANPENRHKYIQSLKFRISTYIDNTHGKAKHPMNGRPIKCIKQRMSGKGGIVRNNLMGKRVNQSARTVIGPDPTLKMGEVAIPESVAANLTVPVKVNKYNIAELTKLVNTNKANEIVTESGGVINVQYASFRKGTELLYNDVVIRNGKEILVTNNKIQLKTGDKLKRNGKFVAIRYPERKRITLQIGQTVKRQLRNKDIVLLNRQPTLHKGSMLAKEVVVKPGKTFRMNLATTKTFNADFDGDEMNIHVPQSVEAITELKMLSATKHNIISAQGSKPNIAIVQDSLLGAYMMTKGVQKMSRGEFFDITMHGETVDGGHLWNPDSIKRIQSVHRKFGKKYGIYNGKSLVSLILPPDLIYENENGADPEEPVVRIYRGVLYEGCLNKPILGASHNSLIQILNKEYGKDVASNFVDNIQFLTNNWLLSTGFSIGLQDCMITSPEKVNEIKQVVERCYVEAQGVEETTQNPGIREIRVTAALSKAKDNGMRIAKNAMSSTNNLLSTVGSGSKGDFFNIAQITGLLGQQNLMGKRVKARLNNGRRTLVHYPFGKLPKKTEYESKGFVRHSFIHGLNPQEFFFHAMSGREGICDTAMGTADSGYIQRKIVKLCEDLKVEYGGTVRGGRGELYQYSYGENGMDPVQMVKPQSGGPLSACDISRLVSRLNLRHEYGMDERKNEDQTAEVKEEKEEKTYEPEDTKEDHSGDDDFTDLELSDVDDFTDLELSDVDDDDIEQDFMDLDS